MPLKRPVIPDAKAGIQENTGFGVKPGMTNYIIPMSSCIVSFSSQEHSGRLDNVIQNAGRHF